MEKSIIELVNEWARGSNISLDTEAHDTLVDSIKDFVEGVLEEKEKEDEIAELTDSDEDEDEDELEEDEDDGEDEELDEDTADTAETQT